MTSLCSISQPLNQLGLLRVLAFTALIRISLSLCLSSSSISLLSVYLSVSLISCLPFSLCQPYCIFSLYFLFCVSIFPRLSLHSFSLSMLALSLSLSFLCPPLLSLAQKSSWQHSSHCRPCSAAVGLRSRSRSLRTAALLPGNRQSRAPAQLAGSLCGPSSSSSSSSSSSWLPRSRAGAPIQTRPPSRLPTGCSVDGLLSGAALDASAPWSSLIRVDVQALFQSQYSWGCLSASKGEFRDVIV